MAAGGAAFDAVGLRSNVQSTAIFNLQFSREVATCHKSRERHPLKVIIMWFRLPTPLRRAMPVRATATDDVKPHRPASGDLHLFVYMAAVGLVLLFAVAAWESFDEQGYTGYLLTVMTGFFLVAAAIPVTLWMSWRRHRDVDAARDESTSWRNWMRGDFDTWAGRRKAGDAAVEILLPLAAVAFGMIGIGTVFHYIAAASAVHS